MNSPILKEPQRMKEEKKVEQIVKKKDETGVYESETMDLFQEKSENHLSSQSTMISYVSSLPSEPITTDPVPLKETNIPTTNIPTNVLSQNKNTIFTIPIRIYLNENITPVLLEGMKLIARERPPNPLQVLGEYLISKSKN